MISCEETNLYPLCDYGSDSELDLEQAIGLPMFFDYESALACAKKMNKPIFTYFTLYGANVTEFEDALIRDQKILSTLKNNYICVILRSDDPRAIESMDIGKLQELGIPAEGYDFLNENKTMGVFNAMLQRYKFVNVNQPLYTIQDANGNIIMNSLGYTKSNTKLFLDFLQKGIAAFPKEI